MSSHTKNSNLNGSSKFDVIYNKFAHVMLCVSNWNKKQVRETKFRNTNHYYSLCFINLKMTLKFDVFINFDENLQYLTSIFCV